MKIKQLFNSQGIFSLKNTLKITLFQKCGILKRVVLLSLIIIYYQNLSAQEYFQQETNYNIKVKLNDSKHELDAFESIQYINNSPDTLLFLFFHLWPNAYSSNNTALAKQLLNSKGKARLFDDISLKGYIDSLDFKIDNEKVLWSLENENPDICRISLNKPAFPGDTLIITTPFHVKLPLGVSSRMGHIGQSYQISQWYPKPAVYDNNGWHQMPYLDQGEFFSEYGSYDVSITLPDNYTVGSTGNLQNESEWERLNNLSADTIWKSRYAFPNLAFPPSSSKFKTLRYTENKVHDFAWFADKRFHVLKGNIELPETGKHITTFAMFTDQESYLWKDAINYINDAILYFSALIGEYPYKNFTAVQSALNAGAGMEYPGLTVIGLSTDAYSLDQVLAHEICHNWFYSALGTNERRWPFLDEGITSSYEERYMRAKYPERKVWELYLRNPRIAKFLHVDQLTEIDLSELEWLLQARRNYEQPLNLPAQDYTTINYSVLIYTKTALGFNYLRYYLGDQKYDAIMSEFYQKWKFRHPGPVDLESFFRMNTSKDLDWFFDHYLKTTEKIDYKILKIRDTRLLLKNKGSYSPPVTIAGLDGDSVKFEKLYDGFTGRKWLGIPDDDYTSFKIDPFKRTPELYRLNNNIKTSGLFRHADPVVTQLLLTVENPEKRSVMYIPAINWNKEDGFMPGLAIYNGVIISKPIEYFVIPFYSFKNHSFQGLGRVNLNYISESILIRMATLSFEGAQFGAPGFKNYQKAKMGLDLFFRNRNVSNLLNHRIFGSLYLATDISDIDLVENPEFRSFFQTGYSLQKSSLINPYNLLAQMEWGHMYQKSSLELNYRLSYFEKNKGLDLRLFAGLVAKNNSIPFYSFSPSGRKGRELYLYQESYPERFSNDGNFWSRQMTLSEGGIVTPVNDTLGYSKWLISLSLTSHLPGKFSRIPVKPFINVLLNDHSAGHINNPALLWEGGIKAGVWNFFEIYVPVIVSENLTSNSFKERIRFVLKLNSFLSVNIPH